MPSTGGGTPLKKTQGNKRTPTTASKGDLLYEMLNFSVPAPFVRGQRMPLRKCNKSDLDNAVKMARVLDLYSPEAIKFFELTAHKFRSLTTRPMETSSLSDLEALLQTYIEFKEGKGKGKEGKDK